MRETVPGKAEAAHLATRERVPLGGGSSAAWAPRRLLLFLLFSLGRILWNEENI